MIVLYTTIVESKNILDGPCYMIGQPSGVCLFLTCDSTRTKYYGDEFRQMSFGKTTMSYTKVTKTGVALCDAHTKQIIDARHRGEAICLSAEGWVYIDNWQWLLYGTE